MPEASQNKKELEAGARTFGIEVEFATHNYELLSFTHIEVCYLYPEGMPMERLQTDAWKIETDANYTFELVSPILSFDDRDGAEQFKSALLQKLQSLVVNGEAKKTDGAATSGYGQEEVLEGEEFKTRRKLGYIMDQLAVFLSKRFLYAPEKGAKHQPIKWVIQYINKDELLKKINWENWDEDTDLGEVLTEKERIAKYDSETELKFKLSEILLYPSCKNHYFCDSQMNVPQTLKEYVTYQAKHKLTKAIKRRKGQVSRNKKYGEFLMPPSTESFFVYDMEEKRVKIESTRDAIKEYDNYRLEEPLSKADKYYAWLRVFSHVTNMVVSTMCERRILVSDESGKEVPSEEFTCANGRRYKIFQVWSKPLYQMIYVVVQKLVYGTLGQLSETPQMEGQRKIMERASGSIKGSNGSELAFTDEYKREHPFLEYYSYVKDLTPLWFKAPLLDVIAEGGEDDRKAILGLLFCEELIITDLIRALMSETQDIIRNRNRSFSMFDGDNDVYDTFFKAMRQTEVALRQYLTTRNGTPTKELNLDSVEKRLANGDKGFIALAEDAKGLNIEFLRRQYLVSYGSLKSSSSPVNVAPWEARWDTLKGPIDLVTSSSDSPYINRGEKYYLVEHRNN